MFFQFAFFLTTNKAFQPYKFILYVIDDFKLFNVQPKKNYFFSPDLDSNWGPGRSLLVKAETVAGGERQQQELVKEKPHFLN